jgi:SAM-dependent methyltransferase/uncharacterized protein YbaR (Trm112 family)
MLTLAEQIQSRRLVCPITRQPLVYTGAELVTRDGERRYPLLDGVPLLIGGEHGQSEYRTKTTSPATEQPGRRQRFKSQMQSLLRRLLACGGDHRSGPSLQAFAKAIVEQPAGALCLSVGGGPGRAHPKLVNLNIGLFPNVDVVADAYELPYADESVDAIYCEAVLEHLEYPDRAVAEMWRVLKTGGQVFAATPFLQMYHGYPDHYQNFTLSGHRRLFERAGFTVVSCGPCVGPTVALSDLSIAYARFYPPIRILRYLTIALVLLPALALRPLDRRLNKTATASMLASSTYVHAAKRVV